MDKVTVSKAIPHLYDGVFSPGSNGVARSPLGGRIFLFCTSAVVLMDWLFPMDTGNLGARFWPHVVRGIVVVVMLLYLSLRLKFVFRSTFARLQTLWLAVLFIRFLMAGDYDMHVLLYMSYYAYWVLVMFVAYCMSAEHRITAEQVAIAGTGMSILMLTKVAIYGSTGFWIGDTSSTTSMNLQFVNSSYSILWFSLMMLLKRKPLTNAFVLVLNVIAIAYTAKRGASVALICGVLMFLLAYAHSKRTRMSLIVAFGAGLLFAATSGFAVWLFQDQLLTRWNDIGDPQHAGSGRLVFWALLWRHWRGTDLLTQLIGFGPQSTYEYLRLNWKAAIPAHNDWLNLIHDFGLLSVFAYALIWASFLFYLRRVWKNERRFFPLCCSAIAIGLCMTAYSLFCYSTDTAWFSMIAGSIFGLSMRPSVSSNFETASVMRSHSASFGRQASHAGVIAQGLRHC